MTLGQKIKKIRKTFGLSQEQLAEIINVSRQAITKWESDFGLPDTENLKSLSNIFNVSIDYLLDNIKDEPILIMKENYVFDEFDKDKYKNKYIAFEEYLKYKYPEPYKIYQLSYFAKKMSKSEKIIDFLSYFTDATYLLRGAEELNDALKNAKMFYVVENGNIQFFITVEKEFIITRPINIDMRDKILEIDNRRLMKGKKIR